MTHPEIDYYRTLGIEPTSSSAEIKAAYREHAKLSHPDSGGSAKVMEQLNDAYAVLSDARARAQYDGQRAQAAAAKAAPRPHASHATAATHHPAASRPQAPRQSAGSAARPRGPHSQAQAAARQYVLYQIQQYGLIALAAGVGLSYLSLQSQLSQSGLVLGMIGFGCLYWLLLQAIYLSWPDLKLSNYQTARSPLRAGRRRLQQLAICTLLWIPLGACWPLVLRLLTRLS